MKVKILRGCAGVFDGKPFSFSSGKEYDIADGLAQDLLRAGHVKQVKAVETAALPASPPREATDANIRGTKPKHTTKRRANNPAGSKGSSKDSTR